MELLKAVILGLIQGITEWLPISSTGHMLLFDELMPLNASESFKNVFLVIIQLGSILAVVVLYFKELWPFKADREERDECVSLWLKVIVASIPTAIIGFLLDDLVESTLSGPFVIALSLFFYGVIYVFIEKPSFIRTKAQSIKEITYRDALLLGLFQSLAVIPGTSRSGSTILGALLLGISRPVGAKFSFFMAIPAMAGASMLRILKSGLSFTSSEWLILLVGTAVAFITSLFVIKKLVEYVRSHSFAVFGVYRMILALVVVVIFCL